MPIIQSIAKSNLRFAKAESPNIRELETNAQLKIVDESYYVLHYLLQETCPRAGQ